MRQSLLTLLAFGFVSACGGSSAPTYYADIKPLVDAYCVTCHSAGNIGPFELLDYAQVKEKASLIRREVTERRMPPWGAAPGHQEYLYDTSLSDEQILMVQEWADADAPMGDPANEGDPIEIDRGGMDRVDLELSMPERYFPQRDQVDDYRCFAMEWPLEEQKFITGFNAIPGNLNSVHHMVAFILPPTLANLVDTFNDLDEAPGYPCFGTAEPTNWEPQNDVQIVYLFGGHWAPGIQGTVLPAGTGQPIAPGSRIVLQVHYNTINEGDLSDLSKIQWQLSDEVTEVGYYLAWLDFLWGVQPESMLIPAGEPDVLHTYASKVPTSPIVAFLAPDLDLSAGAQVHAVFPHMHTIGQQITLTVERSDGEETIVHLPQYDFDWQREYALRDAVKIGPEDNLRIDCMFDNTRESRIRGGVLDPDPVDIVFGTGSVDEMCVGLMYITRER